LQDNIQLTDDGYKLLTSQTKEPVSCPDKDMIATKLETGEIEIEFTRKIKITKR